MREEEWRRGGECGCGLRVRRRGGAFIVAGTVGLFPSRNRGGVAHPGPAETETRRRSCETARGVCAVRVSSAPSLLPISPRSLPFSCPPPPPRTHPPLPRSVSTIDLPPIPGCARWKARSNPNRRRRRSGSTTTTSKELTGGGWILQRDFICGWYGSPNAACLDCS
ncbi:hypothetical protein DAI22_03g393900 [Oryza sativa Japonica Group]|nr:hypothetical protein DAI22_03g393900 [Oryza sativa Japonica Group]